MNPSHNTQENLYPLALPRRVPHFELNPQRKESGAESHSRTVPLMPPHAQLQELHPSGLTWTPAPGYTPSMLVTGRPVVIVEESVVARVLGCGSESDPFATFGRRTHHPAASLGSMSASLPYRHSTILPHHCLEQPTGIAAHGLQAVPDPEALLPSPSRDMSVAMYDSLQGNSKDWYQLVPKEFETKGHLGLNLPSITPLTEDETAPSITPLTEDETAPSITPLIENETAPSITPLTEDETAPSITPLTEDETAPSITPLIEDERAPSITPLIEDETAPSITPLIEDETAPSITPLIEDETAPSITPLIEDETAPSITPLIEDETAPSITPLIEDETAPSITPLIEDETAPSITPLTEDETAPSITPLIEDETADGDTQAMSVQTEWGDATAYTPTSDHIVGAIPDSSPRGPHPSSSIVEFILRPSESPSSSQEQPGDQSLPAYDSEQDCACASTADPLHSRQTQQKAEDTQKNPAHNCGSPQVDDLACQKRDSPSESSQDSFGTRILKAWTDGIVAMAEGRAMPLPNVVKSSIPNQSEDTSHKERVISAENLSAPMEAAQPLPFRCMPLRPSRATLVCAEREEQILQDSDSELELEMPDMESEQQASEQQGLTGPITGEPRDAEKPCDVIPQPPPPPQLGLPRASLHAPVPCPEAVDPESKFGELRLQNCFLNTEPSTLSSGSLFSLGFTPLSPAKLTNSLRIGLLGSSIATVEPRKEISAGGAENHMASVYSEDPPVKKPRLLEMSDNEEILSPASDSEVSSREMQVPQESFPSKRIVSPHEKQREEVDFDENSSTNERAIHHAVVEQQETTPDVVQPDAVQHPHGSTSLPSDCPHQPHEHADDGMDTVDQALPTESARQHPLVPNPVPCGRETENYDDDDDSNDSEENGAGALVTAEREEIDCLSRHAVATSVASDETAVIETLQDEFCSLKSKSLPSPLQTLLTVPATEPEMQSAPKNGDQQIVPESSFSTSLSEHSLYDEGDSSEKWRVAQSHGLEEEEEAETDSLDAPSVLAGALESMESRKKMLESPEYQVSQMSPVRQWSCFPNSHFSVVQPNSQGPDIFQPSHVNLSKPRLRLGLSKRQRCKPLHH